MQSLFEKMGGTYTLGADGNYYPNLALPKEEELIMVNMAGCVKHTYRSTAKGLYTELVEHLNEVDDAAKERMQLLTRQMAEKQHVDEASKARDQLGWVGAKNNIHNAVEEIVLN